MGTLTAPVCAMPRSATVHSTRVAPISATLSPGCTASATRPQAASSADPASSAQVSGFQAPEILRTAATRCGSLAARSRKRSATERTAAKSSLSCCIEPIFFCAIAIVAAPSPASVLLLPLARALLDPGLLGQVASAGRGEDLVDELMRLVVLPFQL